MTMQEESRLSYYQKIAGLSDHGNIALVQHRETKQIYVRKDLEVYDKRVFQYLMAHPNAHFPQIYECIESDGRLTVIEEYIQGQNLEEYLEEHGILSSGETAVIVREICEALKQMHNLPVPIIHRDLKPSNILLGKDGMIRIIDFDAARNYDAEKDTDTVIMGTRHYAAPEQFGYAQTDARTDIYALGVMMNRMVTGNYPLQMRCEGALGSVIQRCIEIDPARRYQTVEALQEALREYADAGRHRPERVRHPHLPPGFRTLRWWKMLLAVIGYGLVAFVCLTMDISTANGAAATGGILWLNRICAAAVWILWIFFWFNYLDVHRVLPLMRKKRSKWIGYILYTVLIAIVFLLLLVVVENHL